MAWGRLDDGLYDHPKLEALGRSKLAAVGLWTLSISWSNRRLTDGSIPADRIRALGGTKAIAELLVTAGLFDKTDDGYAIHDFLVFNDSAVTVMSRRDAAAERQRRHRGVTGDVTPAVTRDKGRDSQRDSAVIARAPAIARPDPTDSESTPQPPASGGRRRRRTNGVDASQYDAVARRDSDEPEREPVAVGRPDWADQ